MDQHAEDEVGMRRVLLVVVAVLVVALAGLALYLRPIAPVATGYAAKVTCSGHFVAGRSVEDAAGDLPPNPLVPLLRTDVDEDAASVRATLLGLWPSTAWHHRGVGCTLAERDPDFAPLDPAARRPRDQPWPSGAEVDVEAARTLGDVDGPALDQAVAGAFAEDDPAGRKNTRAVVVVHDGRLVAERYADGFDADTPLLGWSMGKSIANAIVGRLVAEGDLALDDADLRPNWAGDGRADITLDDLLHMTSGLAFDEVYDPDTDATNMLFRPVDTGDFAAAKPLVADPGTVWSYSSGTTNILCDEAQEASGLGLDLARSLVFDPVGMDSAVMEADVGGGLVCSSFPWMTARDWARFGQWFLQDGEWDGQSLLPPGWVEDSTAPVRLDTEEPYGSQWWLNEGADGDLRMPRVAADAYWASGNEGQQVVVVPSQDLVVVRLGFTSDFGGIDWGLEDLVAGAASATG